MYWDRKNNPEKSIICDSVQDKNSEAYGNCVSCFRSFTINFMSKAYSTQDVPRIENAGRTGAAIALKRNVFDLRYQKDFSSLHFFRITF